MDLFNIIDSNLDKDKATIQEEIYRIAVSSIIALDELERNAEPDPRLKRNLGVVNNTFTHYLTMLKL